jgi:hypothetical protein
MTFKELTDMNEKKTDTKTPEYVRKAVAKYQSKFDRVNINLPRGLKDQARTATGESLNGLIVRLLMEVLKKNGTPYNPPEDNTP